jgi:phosphoglycolate phosphatase
MTSSLTRSWTAVLFDLDGTILDSAPGIIQALGDTLRHLNMPVPSQEQLMAFIGPPLMSSFQDIAGLTEAQAVEALAIYRSDFRKDGAFDSAVFPGIVGLLESLTESKVPVMLATSKYEPQALRILEYFDLSRFFTVVAGAPDDAARTSKDEIVGRALASLAAQGGDISMPVLVGDRVYDVEAANANNIPAIIVEWGYGSPAEAQGAIATVYSADMLRDLLLG